MAEQKVPVDQKVTADRWCKGTKEVVLRIKELDPTGSDKEILKEIREMCKMKPGWKDPEYDSVSGGAPFYLGYLLRFLNSEGRLPTAKEREKMWMDT